MDRVGDRLVHHRLRPFEFTKPLPLQPLEVGVFIWPDTWHGVCQWPQGTGLVKHLLFRNLVRFQLGGGTGANFSGVVGRCARRVAGQRNSNKATHHDLRLYRCLADFSCLVGATSQQLGATPSYAYCSKVLISSLCAGPKGLGFQ